MTKTKKQNLNLRTERLCLDFANTLDWHASAHPVETLTTYADLVAWSHEVGLLSERIARQLIAEAERQPKQAAAILERARTLREAIAEMQSRSRLVRTPEGLNWDWGGGENDLDQMLWWVIRSATDVMTSDELYRVGQCADDRGCGWLFLDTSKNHSRRWCAMKDCGNRAKARRYYKRAKSAA